MCLYPLQLSQHGTLMPVQCWSTIAGAGTILGSVDAGVSVSTE